MAVAQRNAALPRPTTDDQKNNESPAGRHPALTAMIQANASALMAIPVTLYSGRRKSGASKRKCRPTMSAMTGGISASCPVFPNTMLAMAIRAASDAKISPNHLPLLRQYVDSSGEL
jgi:hypothetical protein